MTAREITYLRLLNQQLLQTKMTDPAKLVAYMGCIQAQDFAGAKWAIGCRTDGVTETEIDRCFDEGKILRTHVLRSTWHFVSPEDIRWMLKLTAPRVRLLNNNMLRKFEIDNKILRRSKDIIIKALTGGQQLSKDQLTILLQKARINTEDIRVALIIIDAELDGLICSGKRAGKQFTYALLDERVGKEKVLGKDEAIAELAKRYFISHGPATIQDFSWWSGLTIADARKGIVLNHPELKSQIAAGQEYFMSKDTDTSIKAPKTIHLLPSFDEFMVAYKDRGHFLNEQHISITGHGIFKPAIIINGRIAGIWKRVLYKDKVVVVLQAFEAFNQVAQNAVKREAKKYSIFVNKEIEIVNSN